TITRCSSSSVEGLGMVAGKPGGASGSVGMGSGGVQANLVPSLDVPHGESAPLGRNRHRTISEAGMYCSTCGARVPRGRAECDTCGAPLARRVSLAARAAEVASPAGLAAGPAIRHCPRCGYHGEGISYFSRGTHLAGLVGATVLTAGAMGAGGLVYYVARRDHQACPRCGRGWGRHGQRALVRTGAGPQPLAPVPGAAMESASRGWSIALLVLAAILMVVGIVEFEMIPLMLGVVSGAGGVLLNRSANRAREERRA